MIEFIIMTCVGVWLIRLGRQLQDLAKEDG